MKQKRFLRILLVVALLAALTTTVYAYMFHKSQTVANRFTPANVTCEIHETFKDNKKSDITVKNTGNIDAYIRVRILFHWEDSKGNVVARDIDPDAIQYNESDWIKSGEYYYYKTPVGVDSFTSDLFANNFTYSMNAVEEKEEEDGKPTVYYYYYPVMEVLAEAIQSQPEEAVTVWGVEVEDGQISKK